MTNPNDARHAPNHTPNGSVQASQRGEPEDARRGYIAPTPRTPAEAAADRELAEAERAVAQGSADSVTAARVAALAGARTHEVRRAHWMRTPPTAATDASAPERDWLALVHDAVADLGRVVAAGPSQRGNPTLGEAPAGGDDGDGEADDGLRAEALGELAHLAGLIAPAALAVAGDQTPQTAHHAQALHAALDAHRRALDPETYASPGTP